MLSRKIFENLHIVVAIFEVVVLFEQFLGKFFALKSECFTKYDAFCSYIFDYASLVIVKVRKYGKIVFIKNMFENGWWGNASPPGSTPARTDNNVSSLRRSSGLASV